MEIKRYRNSNTDMKRLIKPLDVIKENFTRIDTVLKYLEILRPDIVGNYVPAVKKRLYDDIGNYSIDYSNLNLDELRTDLIRLQDYLELQDLIVRFSFYYFNVPESNQPTTEEVEVLSSDWLKSLNVLRFHRVKALVDILERKEAINLWKKLVYKATEDFFEEVKDEIHPPIAEIAEGWIKAGEEGKDAFDHTVVKFDDYKVAVKFDRCPVYDSVKHLDDQEVVYLSYCWTGVPEEEMNKSSRRKFTPYTLHTADYCVEFFWNNDVHPNAKPPSREFFDELGDVEGGK